MGRTAKPKHIALCARARGIAGTIVAAEHFAHTFRKQADKLQSLITAAKVPEIEPIWTTLFAKALEGKDVKDLLVNVGSGGGAAPAAGGAAPAAGGASDAPAAEEKKEEGKSTFPTMKNRGHTSIFADRFPIYREGGVRRRHGLRSLRLSVSLRRLASKSKYLDDKAGRVFWQAGLRHDMNDDQDDDMWWSGEEIPSRVSRFRSYSLNACGACQAASLFVKLCSPSFPSVMCYVLRFPCYSDQVSSSDLDKERTSHQRREFG
jgi:ribosomal protein L12E/L44/L45/RPP1/RPP2